MTSKRTRRTRAKQRRRQIEAKHPINDAWAGPEMMKALKALHESLPEHYYSAAPPREPEVGDLVFFDWGEPQDHCIGVVSEDDVEPVIHPRPDCPHDHP